eukprot:4948446-Amphidinium_carterae.1
MLWLVEFTESCSAPVKARLLVELASRLRALRATCERSHFFATHEFVGAAEHVSKRSIRNPGLGPREHKQAGLLRTRT